MATMKRQKSRRLMSRTISRVKSRLSSLGSSTEPPSPNPLVAPPVSPNRPPRAHRTVPQRSLTRGTLRTPKISRPADYDGGPAKTSKHINTKDGTLPGPGRAPSYVAALDVNTSTWTVFGSHAKYPATAYVNIDLASKVGAEFESAKVSPGHLYDLKIAPIVTGPGAIINKYGDSTRQLLVPGEAPWILVLHIGFKDTSLAAKLSTSFRSFGGRLKRVSNLDVINRWLHVLQEDITTETATLKPEAVVVQVKIAFKHSLLPRTTTLMEERSIAIATTEGEGERANAEPDEGDDDNADEERLREMRVLGAPWL